MKKRLLAGLLVMAVIISVLSTTAFAVASNNTKLSPPEGSPDIDISDIPVYEPGEYDLGNGVMLTVEHIPGMEVASDTSINSDASDISSVPPDIDISDIPVYEPGVYDLGDGVTLTVEHIPGGCYDAFDSKARLRESNDKLPLTTSWSWFCDDEPILATNLKIYNNSSKNPGNLFGYVWANDGAMGAKYYTAGIAPGDMATLSFVVLDYSVYLSGSVKGQYKVLVTDWP